jgi:hypothetical protein
MVSHLAEVRRIYRGRAAGLAMPAQRCEPISLARLALEKYRKGFDELDDCFIGNIRVQLKVTKEVMTKLEAACDQCQMAEHEGSLCCEMKLKTLGLSSLQRTIARQESRAMWLSEGDAPTKFFHVQAGARRVGTLSVPWNMRGITW